MSDVAIKVENISKLYQIGDTSSGSLRETLSGLFSSGKEKRTEDFWALKDISFEVKKGEAVGIIGKNGAGKSTLLKVLSRITEPTQGRIEINGRVSSLLEVGTGFHPELTGRENVYLNGTILGMSRAEVKAKFDEIVEFSGVEKFLDTPVKRYSSGMKVRLAFAVAAHLEPEILIIDEVLAVGDAEFQKKCLGKMEDVAGEGRTILFVSHNMGAINSLCNKGIILKNGCVTHTGSTEEVIAKYIEQNTGLQKNHIEFDPNNNNVITFIRASVNALDKSSNESIQKEDQVAISVEYAVKDDISGSNISISLYKEGVLLSRSWDTDMYPELLKLRKKGDYMIKFIVPANFLTLGNYTVTMASGIVNQSVIEAKHDCLSFEVENYFEDLSKSSNIKNKSGLVDIPCTWEVADLLKH